MLDEQASRSFSVVLTAGRSQDFAAESLDAALDWESAVIAVVSAVLERGGSIVVPANTELAHIVASLALPHAPPHAAERSREVAPVRVVETGGISETARQELAPFAHRNAITYHDQENRVVDLPPLPTSSDERLFMPIVEGHHPITPGLLASADMLGVIVIGNTFELDPDLAMLSQSGATRVALLASSRAPAMGSWAAEHDPTRELLNRLQGDQPTQGPLPYGILAEALVESWLGQQQR